MNRLRWMDWDRRVYLLLHGRMRIQWANRPMIWVTQSGTKGTVWCATALVLFAFGGTAEKRSALLAIAALLVAEGLINLILKPAIRRERPYGAGGPGLTHALLVSPPGPHSWPSAHAGSSMAAGLTLAILVPALALPALALAALIGYSRIYVGVHYPLDVLAGAAIGVFSALAVLAAAALLAHLGVALPPLAAPHGA